MDIMMDEESRGASERAVAYKARQRYVDEEDIGDADRAGWASSAASSGHANAQGSGRRGGLLPSPVHVDQEHLEGGLARSGA
jgi:hypothetical protein